MSTFSGIPLATLLTYREDAQAALQRLLSGTQAVSVRYGDKFVQYNAADAGLLRDYLASLQQAITIAQGQANTRPFAVAVWER